MIVLLCLQGGQQRFLHRVCGHRQISACILLHQCRHTVTHVAVALLAGQANSVVFTECASTGKSLLAFCCISAVMQSITLLLLLYCLQGRQQCLLHGLCRHMQALHMQHLHDCTNPLTLLIGISRLQGRQQRVLYGVCGHGQVPAAEARAACPASGLHICDSLHRPGRLRLGRHHH